MNKNRDHMSYARDFAGISSPHVALIALEIDLDWDHHDPTESLRQLDS